MIDKLEDVKPEEVTKWRQSSTVKTHLKAYPNTFIPQMYF